MLKLSDLKAYRAAMTPGEWRAGAHERDRVFCKHGATLAIERVLVRVNSQHPEYNEHDAAGIAATHNAADTLIEIVEAALEWRTTIGRPRGDRAADVAEQRLIRLLDEVHP